jgi:hypothetical protein
MAGEADQPLSDELLCHGCGYDLRAHPADGKCPECGASVAEAKRLAAIPKRPAWRDSDPRWRRRMLAGVWVLMMLPVMNLLKTAGWAGEITMPSILNWRGRLTLDRTFFSESIFFEPVLFCIGIVLLFSKEGGRRASRLDWTRRWGVICSYVVFLLDVAEILFFTAMNVSGWAGYFIYVLPTFHPKITQFMNEASRVYFRFGPVPSNRCFYVIIVFSSATVMLACIPLWNALRSSGPRWAAGSLVAPLTLFAVFYLVQAAGHISHPQVTGCPIAIYFRPHVLVGYLASDFLTTLLGTGPGEFAVEIIKWLDILTIAIWLTVAQFAAWRGGKKVNRALPV